MTILTKSEIEAIRAVSELNNVVPAVLVRSFIRHFDAMREALDAWVEWDRMRQRSLVGNNVYDAYIKVVELTWAASIEGSQEKGV